MVAPAAVDPVHAFAGSRVRFEAVVSWLESAPAHALSHGELEQQLQVDARELFRQLLQEHLDLRADSEPRIADVTDHAGLPRPSAEPGHQRGLATVFGDVQVRRIAYRLGHKPGAANLHPADGVLNLPAEKHSHGLRHLAAVESSRGSFDGAVEAIERNTGQRVGKRQVEQLAGRAAVDFEAFYAQRKPAAATGDVLVLSCDGKGVVMRPEGLRPATAKAAATTNPKLATRLSKGEKRNRKRMAEVGAVYDITAVPRTTTDILPGNDAQRRDATAGPTARNKWLTASVVDDAKTVVAAIFAEAHRRDPKYRRTWIALVDGNNHQIDRINAEAKTRELTVTILIDFVHVLEYLWKAAWSFHAEGDPTAETWVRRHAQTILAGGATRVAGALRRAATTAGLEPSRRENADTCASYLTSKADYLNYQDALQQGWPIATGIIEGACRHIVKDRLDLTGARWGLPGAEAILKLRAIRSNGDMDSYWSYHLSQEQHRIHQTRYANDIIPRAA